MEQWEEVHTMGGAMGGAMIDAIQWEEEHKQE